MGFFVLCFYQGKEARRRSGFRKENVEFHWVEHADVQQDVKF